MQQVAPAPAAPTAAPSPRKPASTWLGLDAFTLAIAASAAVLVPVLFVVVLSQPKATPMPDTTPSGVVHNYYLAVMQDDLSAAYGYFSAETRGWLSYEQFAARVSSRPETRSVRIQDEHIEDSTARVTASVTLYVPTGPISSGEVSSQHTLVLRIQSNAWRIVLPQPADGANGRYSPYELYGW